LRNEFLTELKVSSKECNIVENTLLELSGAKLGLHGSCSFEIGSDPSRLVFSFEDMDKANADKVIGYLQQMGDESVTEGYGSRKYGTSIPKSMNESAMSYSQSPQVKENYESHSIEVDGKCFYKQVFPQLKNAIEDPKNQASLTNYQELSKKCFEQKAVESSATSSKDAFFQPADGSAKKGPTEPSVSFEKR